MPSNAQTVASKAAAPAVAAQPAASDSAATKAGVFGSAAATLTPAVNPAPNPVPKPPVLPQARNVVFLSPQFPNWVTKFAIALGKYPQVNVLGIGDDSYDSLPAELKGALTEYYRVDSLNDYEAILKAVGFFTHKYGKIDRFESLNEHWLETEARIRSDFNIPGPRAGFIELVRHKSLMKTVFERAGVATIQGITTDSLATALEFAKRAGYPLVVKPDAGSGASFTYRVDDDEALSRIFAQLPADTPPVVVEQYIDGNTLTYDGMVDARGKIVFDSSSRTDQSIMEVVNKGGNAYYVCLPYMPEDVRSAGAAIVAGYDLRERFFHIEIFERRDGGGLVGLEINLRPPGAWLTDAMNVSQSTDVYDRWAAMIAGAPQPTPGPDRYYTAYASRKNFNSYAHTHEQCVDYLGDRLVIYSRIDKILQAAMGDEAYLAKANSYDEAMAEIDYVQKRA